MLAGANLCTGTGKHWSAYARWPESQTQKLPTASDGSYGIARKCVGEISPAGEGMFQALNPAGFVKKQSNPGADDPWGIPIVRPVGVALDVSVGRKARPF